MNEIIEKYEARLNYLNKAVEQTKHLMDEDTLDMMNNMKILLTEVVTDFKAICALVGRSEQLPCLNCGIPKV
jgi:DNA-binding ferritin-like protein